jgi:A/G-specific adenine glycosylase
MWFDANRRPMPWREDPGPYRVWVSEIMLQQTQVVTVIPYFERFIKRFPSVESLAAADTQAVLKLWEGLGYYSRARNLLKAAKQVVEAGKFPESASEWMKLPGVGEYTSAAIASIANGEAVPSVDGNVLRVFSRFWGIADDITLASTRETIRSRLTPHIRKSDSSKFNQAMMELGALVCKPRMPDCVSCPLAPRCIARSRALTDCLPVKKRAGKIPSYTDVTAVIVRHRKILLCRRHETGLLGGMWEFPGGRREGREALHSVLMRGVKEQTGLTLFDLKQLGRVTHEYSHFRVTLHVYKCRAEPGRAKALMHEDVRWVTIDDLKALPLSTLQRKVVDLI